MKKAWSWVKSPKGRKSVYKLTAAAGAVLVVYGVVDQQTVNLVVTEAGLLLGVSAVAHANVKD